MIKFVLVFVLSANFSYAMSDSLNPKSQCDEEITHSHYSLCYSQKHRQAKWTFHKLTTQSINGPAKRKNNYRMDPLVIDAVTKNDYKNSGYDRGHLVPAGDMKLNNTAMSETFFMTNMSPQKPNLNRKIWNQLENAIRTYVKQNGDAYIVTAPILSDGLAKLPSQVSIPAYYYKVIYFPSKKIMKAYLLENRAYKKGTRLQDLQVTVDHIESLTHIDFFSALVDKLEDKLESQISYN